MASQAQQKFSFEIQGFDKDTFHVVRFTGEEGYSRLYRFEIVLFSQNKSVDFDKALSNPATFTILRGQGKQGIPFHGILANFEQLSASGPYAFYRAELVPKAWLLTLTTHNQVFLNQKIDQFLSAVFKDGGLSPEIDFSLSLQNNYPSWDYLCQYDETHFQFSSRWMEKDGLYFFFEQGDSGEKMVVTDTLTAHAPMPQGESFRYSPPSSMQVGHDEEVITDLTLTQHRLPQKVQLKDYNYETPSLDLTAEAKVSDKGQGVHYLYGLHFLNKTQGNRLAKVRAEDFKCREKVYSGVSTIPFVRTGYTFSVTSHFRDDFNAKYQTIACRHEGSQEAWLIAGLGVPLTGEKKEELYYRNHFTAIPADAQFRAQLKTERPKVSGTICAKVDAEGTGQYAEVDSQGRYKIILPFDLSGRKDGHASAWVRMAQPYAGGGFGMHFPLHKGCEVLLNFTEGDPDRPLISAALPNPEHASPISDQTQTKALLTTSGGNKIHIEDQEGNQRILLSSPTQGSYVRIGSHNDPEDNTGGESSGGESGGSSSGESGSSSGGESGGDSGGESEDKGSIMSEEGLKLWTGGWLNVKAQFSTTLTMIDVNEITLGAETSTVIGYKMDNVLGGLVELQWPSKLSYSMAEERLKGEVSEMYVSKNKLGASVKKLIASDQQVKGEVTKVIADQTKTLASKAEVTAAKQQVAAEVSQTYATKDELTAQKEEIAADIDFVCANIDATIATKEEVLAAKNEVAGEVELVRGTVNQQAGSIQRMAGDITNMAGDITALAGAVEYL